MIFIKLQDCKDQIANKYGYENWQGFIAINSFQMQQKAIDEVAELYAQQFKVQLLKVQPAIKTKTEKSRFGIKLYKLFSFSWGSAPHFFSLENGELKCSSIDIQDGKITGFPNVDHVERIGDGLFRLKADFSSGHADFRLKQIVYITRGKELQCFQEYLKTI